MKNFKMKKERLYDFINGEYDKKHELIILKSLFSGCLSLSDFNM